MRWSVISSIRPSFPGLSRSSGQVPHVILTRSPLIHPKQASGFSVRLACVKHAASVHPEPGSNSPNKNKMLRPVTIKTDQTETSSPWQHCASSHGGRTTTATIQKNGIKQTWHTIEFSNNHTHQPTHPHKTCQPTGNKTIR